jgi:hypothetical protein
VKISELSELTGFSPGRIRQWIIYEKVPIPGHRVTKGGHHRFTMCDGLKSFIQEHKAKKAKLERKKRDMRIWKSSKKAAAGFRWSYRDSTSKAKRYLHYIAEWVSSMGNEFKNWEQSEKEHFTRILKPVVVLHEELEKFKKLEAERMQSLYRKWDLK